MVTQVGSLSPAVVCSAGSLTAAASLESVVYVVRQPVSALHAAVCPLLSGRGRSSFHMVLRLESLCLHAQHQAILRTGPPSRQAETALLPRCRRPGQLRHPLGVGTPPTCSKRLDRNCSPGAMMLCCTAAIFRGHDCSTPARMDHLQGFSQSF
jgi:hypothetical protein